MAHNSGTPEMPSKDDKKRDEVLKKMLQTPPTLNKPIKAKKPEKKA